MASSTRKRKKPNSSHPSSPSPSRSQSQQRNTTSTQENQSDQTKGEDNDQPTSTAPIETTDEEELTLCGNVTNDMGLRGNTTWTSQTLHWHEIWPTFSTYSARSLFSYRYRARLA
ncbi:hypothetical protein PGTUg99_028383 [Puccinia graminis f. sp. tritici]|uniref:Uncharacterized protein n=1 Tax=Puccinia graminis f. sp. tritici TaxID=56615 RepID=A0A5B0P1C3_PUCGR|nr:hypothetical protein PGTUg99_028383 [Puccinia graminis f. sp. tritici]